jgi:hypothetical protein
MCSRVALLQYDLFSVFRDLTHVFVSFILFTEFSFYGETKSQRRSLWARLTRALPCSELYLHARTFLRILEAPEKPRFTLTNLSTDRKLYLDRNHMGTLPPAILQNSDHHLALPPASLLQSNLTLYWK